MFSFDVVVLLACFIACRALTDDEISKFTSAVTITTSNGNTTITTRTGEPDHDTTEDTCTIRTSILPLEESWTMAQNPTRLSQQANLCLPMGTIGIGINGVRMYSPFNKEIENAVEGDTAECFDVCNGHSDSQGRYHYHQNPICIVQSLQETSGQLQLVNQLVGVALDGFPIYVSTTRTGALMTPRRTLDRCNGQMRNQRYEYRITTDFPYILGCFRGDVIGHDYTPGTRCYYACRPDEGASVPTAGDSTMCVIPSKKENDMKNSRLYNMLKELLQNL